MPSDQSFEMSVGLQKNQQTLPVTSFDAIAIAPKKTPETLCNTGRQHRSRVVVEFRSSQRSFVVYKAVNDFRGFRLVLPVLSGA